MAIRGRGWARQASILRRLATAAALPKVATLVDTFDTSINTTTWPLGYGGQTVDTGRLKLGPTGAGSAYAAIQTGTNLYDLTESSYTVEVPNVSTSTGGTSPQQEITLTDGNDGTGTFVRFQIDGTTLRAQNWIGYTPQDTEVTATYNSTTHRWFKISHTASTVTMATSPDGSSWSTFATFTAKSWMSAVEVYLGANIDNASASAFYFDNLNNPPVGTTKAEAGQSDGTSTAANSAIARDEPATGSSTGTSTAANTAIARSLSLAGASTGTSTAANTAIARDESLATSSTGTSTAANSAIARAEPLVTASTGTSTAAGTLVNSMPLAGASTGSSQTLADALRDRLETASSTGTSTASGALVREEPLTGSSTGTSTTSAAAVAAYVETGASTGTSDASNSAIARSEPLAGSSTGTSLAVGAEADEKMLFGASTGTSDATGTPSIPGAEVGQSDGTSTATATLARSTALEASSTGTSVAAADALRERALPAYPLLWNNFNGQTPGATITTGNSANSGSGFTTVLQGATNPAVYDTVDGREAGKFSTTATTNQSYAAWTYTGQPRTTGSALFRLTAYPTSSATLVFLLDGSSNAFIIKCTTTGQITAQNAVPTAVFTSSASVIPLNDWFRIEWDVTHNTTTGSGAVRLYSADNALLYSNSASSTNTGAQSTVTRLGNVNLITSAAYSVWVDDARVHDNAHADGTSAAAGLDVRERSLAGSSTATSSASATASRATPLAASAAGTSDAVATGLRARGEAATATGTSAATGAIERALPLVGAATGTSDAAAALDRDTALVGQADGTSDATSEAPARDMPLEGSSTGTSTAIALSGSGSSLSGSSTGTTDASADILRSEPLDGSATGTSDAAGTLDSTPSGEEKFLNGAAAGTSTATATLGVASDLTGQADGTSAATAHLGRTIDLSGSSDGISDVEFTALGLGYLISMSATALGVSSAQAEMARFRQIVAGSDGRSSLTGRISRFMPFSGDAVGTSDAVGTARVITTDLTTAVSVVVFVEPRDFVSSSGSRSASTFVQSRAHPVTLSDRDLVVRVGSRESS